ncbi:MAG: hypothetical protein MRECE_16c004 [Mycoplasmataceae bacterium CE_OT135]|nr:MAG: hypothetical protein MRECE_16c004 [Mycoplasmataceae bacterium CE_OT135]
MNELKCSKCGKQTNYLFSFSCSKCVGKKCPYCGRKRGKERCGLIDPHAQLECSKCSKKKTFLYQEEKVCEQCSAKELLPSWRICFCPLNNNLSHCDLCGEELPVEYFECPKCYCKKFGKIYDDSKQDENISARPKNLPVAKEIRTFFLKLKIKDSDGKIKKLSKKQDLEIVWTKGEGKFSKLETGSPPGGEVQIVSFWKDGKKYDLAIGRLLVFKGWFGDKVSSIYEIEPVPEKSFTIIVDKEDLFSGLEMRNYQWRKQGKVLVGILIALVILWCAAFLPDE